MMGQQSGLQERLFYEFRLDEWVPVDHLLRKIDAVLDLSSLRRELEPFYSQTGRHMRWRACLKISGYRR